MQDEFLRLQSMLQKTIVFITHDFDEALRLSDRIAIMKDGAVDQLGTPEEIVTNPATAYVEEFTKDIARDKIVTVQKVMDPGEAPPSGADTVPGDAHLSEVAGKLLRAEGPVSVVDGEGRPIGVVTRDQVIDSIFGSAEPD